MEGIDPSKKNGVYSLAEGLGTGILAAVSLALSPDSQSQICPLTTVVHSAVLAAEPRVSGCE